MLRGCPGSLKKTCERICLCGRRRGWSKWPSRSALSESAKSALPALPARRWRSLSAPASEGEATGTATSAWVAAAWAARAHSPRIATHGASLQGLRGRSSVETASGVKAASPIASATAYAAASIDSAATTRFPVRRRVRRNGVEELLYPLLGRQYVIALPP